MTQVSNLALGLEFISLTCAMAGLSSHDPLFQISTPTTQAPAEAERSGTTRVKKVMTEGSGAESWDLK